MKKGKGTKHTIHMPGTDDTTLCGKPMASAILWSKKTPPTEAHTEWFGNKKLCKKCYEQFATQGETAPEKGDANEPVISDERKTGKRAPALASLKAAPKDLVVTYKGTEHRATVNADGTITVNGKTFNSPSRAGKAITGREVDGWTFWSYDVPGEGLKKLNTLREQKA